MKDREIVKNLLQDKTCENCLRRNKKEDDNKNICYIWMGEAVGWQWRPISEDNTCGTWIGKDE